MKQFLPAIALLTVLVGCAAGSPPNAVERTLYEIRTNYIEVIALKTNVVRLGTNMVVAIEPVTNYAETYYREPRESVVAGIQTGGAIATTFGFGAGGMIASLILGAYGAWATWQNSRKKKAITVLTNNVQVGRETILATAGPATEAVYVESISNAQVKADVKDIVSKVAKNNVDTKEAREEAASVVSLGKKSSVSHTA